MDAAQASPVATWMAVSREQNDHPLVRCRARSEAYDGLASRLLPLQGTGGVQWLGG